MSRSRHKPVFLGLVGSLEKGLRAPRRRQPVRLASHHINRAVKLPNRGYRRNSID